MDHDKGTSKVLIIQYVGFDALPCQSNPKVNIHVIKISYKIIDINVKAT